MNTTLKAIFLYIIPPLYIFIICSTSIITTAKDNPIPPGKSERNLVFSPTTEADLDEDLIADSLENELIAKYAPLIILDKNEKYFPTNVDYILNNSELNNEAIDIDESVYTGSENKDDWELYARAYLSKQDNIILQYWYLFAFNDPYIGSGYNHEGDWEHITIELNSENEPMNIYYANHGENNPGIYYCWHSCIEKVDSHPIVYIANGSHASFSNKKDIGPNFNEVRFIEGEKWSTWMGNIVNVGEIDSYGKTLVDFIQEDVQWGNTQRSILKVETQSPRNISYQPGWKWNEKTI